jgi:hypothetical protein
MPGGIHASSSKILGRDIIFSKYLLAFEERAQVIYYRQSKR